MYIQNLFVPLQRNRGYRRNAEERRRNVGRPAQQSKNSGTGDKKTADLVVPHRRIL